MELRKKCERETSTPQSNSSSNSTIVDSLNNVAFSSINLMNSPNSLKSEDRRLLDIISNQNNLNYQNNQSQKQRSTNQQKASTSDLSINSFSSAWRSNLLDNSLMSLNVDNQFEQGTLRSKSFQQDLSLFNNGNLNNSNSNQNNQINLINLNSNESNKQYTNTSNLDSNYNLNLNSAINYSSLLAQQSNLNTNTNTTYNQLLQNIYPLLDKNQAIYNLITSTSGHLSNQLYPISNLNDDKFNIKNDHKRFKLENYQNLSNCNSPIEETS